MQVTGIGVSKNPDGTAYIAMTQGSNQGVASVVLRDTEGNFSCLDHRCIWKRTHWRGSHGSASPCEHIPLAIAEYARYERDLVRRGLIPPPIDGNLAQQIREADRLQRIEHEIEAFDQEHRQGRRARTAVPLITPDNGGLPDGWNSTDDPAPAVTAASALARREPPRCQSCGSSSIGTAGQCLMCGIFSAVAPPEPEAPPDLPRFGRRKITLIA